MGAREKLIDLVRGKNVYCYGAGNYGKIVAYALMDIGIQQKGFIVTDKSKSPDRVLKIPVLDLEQSAIGEDDIVLICANSLIQAEIEKELVKRKVLNYYCLSEEMIVELDRTTKFEIEADTDKYVNVLLYHRVCNIDNDPWKIAVNPLAFELQIKYLKDNFDILRFEDDWKNVKKKSIVITFDDGYVDNFKYAVPILEKYNVPATIFISTDNIGNPDQFWWDELADMIFQCDDLKKQIEYQGGGYWLNSINDKKKFCHNVRCQLMKLDQKQRKQELQRLSCILKTALPKDDMNRTMNEEEIKRLSKIKCITIGAHTKGHCKLSALSKDKQFLEIKESKDILEQITQTGVTTFSYPFGNDGDYTEETVEIVKQCGFVKAAAVKGGLYSRGQGEFEIPRNNIPGGTELVAFQKIIRKIWYEY